MLENIEITNVAPTIVYVYPQTYTYEEIKKNVNVLHKIADKESNGVIYCLCDNIDYQPNDKIELCYPIDKTQYKKFKSNELKTIPRSDCVCADFIANSYSEVPLALKQLTEFALNQEYKPTNLFCIVYNKEKNQKFTKSSKKAPKYTMKIQIQVEKIT